EARGEGGTRRLDPALPVAPCRANKRRHAAKRLPDSLCCQTKSYTRWARPAVSSSVKGGRGRLRKDPSSLKPWGLGSRGSGGVLRDHVPDRPCRAGGGSLCPRTGTGRGRDGPGEGPVGRWTSPRRRGSRRTRPRDPDPVRERGVTGRLLPSGENIGRLVVDELVVELRQQPTKVVVEAAVTGVGGVAGEGAAAHRRRPTKVVDASAAVGGVAREGAVSHRQLSEEVVLDAAA